MNWTDRHPLQLEGLDKARQLIQLMAANVSNAELSHEDIVAISIRIDQILLALKALAESNSMSTLDDELKELLGEEE